MAASAEQYRQSLSKISFPSNHHLVCLIVDYISPSDALDRISCLHQAIIEKHCLCGNAANVRQLGMRLQSPGYVARQLSHLYCTIFQKQQPQKEVTCRRNSYREDYSCDVCQRQVYLRHRHREEAIACPTCYNSAELPRLMYGGSYQQGFANIPIYKIPIASRAFRSLATNPNTRKQLLDFARTVFDHVHSCKKIK